MERGRAYGYRDAEPSHSQSYLNEALSSLISAEGLPGGARALDYGCGNGWFANRLADHGLLVTGADISVSGIEVGRHNFPRVTFSNDVSTEHLKQLGPFALATCIEVIAHCYRPRDELIRLKEVLKPGGTLVLSTPYHGYWKYLALAVSGRMEQ